VGPNGSGKTTLLRILAGQLDSDSGQVHMPSAVRCDYLQQQADFVPGRTVWDEACGAIEHLVQLAEESERLAQAISQTEDPAARGSLEQRFDHLQEELTRQDAYHLNHRVQRILQGVGLATSSFVTDVSHLSGGQQNRLMLAKLLLSAPEIMLLDEPSNHLDIEATAWLEDYLVASQQTLIVVSHDRFFLDKVTNRTLELFRGTVVSYRGNFTAYWRQKAERLELERRTYENQQAEIARLKDFIRRNQYGQKHAQAEDRRKKLQRIEPVAAPREIEVPAMHFPPVKRSGDLVLRAQKLDKAYSEPLFRQLTLDIQRGQRWGILGRNGSGKTTLLRCLLGLEAVDSGVVALGTGVVVGYFDQLLRSLAQDDAVVDAVRPDGRDFTLQQRRDLLARFGIRGDMVFQPLRQLSGGEQNRVALSRLAASDANLLVLDEPTNHLDLWARAALETALREFAGTVIFVSHDRFFINQIADHLLLLDDGGHQIVHGNYDTYEHLKRVAKEASTPPPTSVGCPRVSEPPRSEAHVRDSGRTRRKRRFPYRKVEDLESDIIARESQLEQLHHELTQPHVLRDGQRVKEIQALIEAQRVQLQMLYEHWEEAAELNG
jgi:ATP-binding cassette subfamily F protein 3